MSAPLELPVPVFGTCFSYVDVAQSLVAGVTLTKTWTLPGFDVPNDATHIGTRLVVQAWTLPPTFPAGIVLSNGVEAVLGR